MGTMRGLLLVLLLSSATVTDLLWRRIYNWTTYTTLGWVILLQLLTLTLKDFERNVLGAVGQSPLVVPAMGMLPWRESLMGFALGFAIMFVLYSVFRGGAGDLKLVAVLGALMGANRIIEVLIYSYIQAGIFAACLVVGVAGPRSIFAFVARSRGLGDKADPAQGMRDCLRSQVPMAPFLACGTLLALVCG
jgi:Flp pilus assembly protein protease CpaA